jgi:hypothetical protein
VDEVEGRKSEVCEDSTINTSFVFLYVSWLSPVLHLVL